MSRSPLLTSNNHHQYKRNQFKSQRRNTQKRSSCTSQFQHDDQIFNEIIKQTPQQPVKVISYEKEDIDQEHDYSIHMKYSSPRKTSSNLPTANNSRTQTPKTSFDSDDNTQNTFQNVYFQKAVYDKLSKRKWSRDSSNGYDNIEEPQYHNDHINNQQQHKSKADDFKIKYKTELCKYFEINGTCKFGDNCAYAHGKDNLRTKVTKTSAYRTRKCKQFFENGFCPYGNRCQFAHAIQSNIINNPNRKEHYSYKKIIEILNNEHAKLYNDNISLVKPRLPIFESIIKNIHNKHSILAEDIRALSNDVLHENSSIGYKSNYVMNCVENENNIENILSKEEEESFCRMLNL